MVRCVCPVCRQDATYPAAYAHKWHRCLGGCQAAPARMLVVPDGVGILDQEVEAAWRRATRRGKLLRLLGALLCLSLVPAPLLGPECGLVLPWVALLTVAGLGATLASAGAHAAWVYTAPRPRGL